MCDAPMYKTFICFTINRIYGSFTHILQCVAGTKYRKFETIWIQPDGLGEISSINGVFMEDPLLIVNRWFSTQATLTLLSSVTRIDIITAVANSHVRTILY